MHQTIGLLAAGLVVVVAAGCGSSPAVAAVVEATPSPTPIASATRSPSQSVAPTAPTSSEPTPTLAALAGTVVEVVDGDTIRVELPSGLERVRIIGIDTPEVVHPSQPEACFGAEATAFAKETLEGQVVTLELDPTQDERDQFDRLLAHVYVGDELYAADAISGGYGTHYVYEEPSIHAADLDAAADAARDAGLGIWASCEGRVDLPVVAVEPVPFVGSSANPNCHPSYNPCVPYADHDLDCADIGFRVAVVGPDEYRLDGEDNDGRGCESY